MENFNVFYWRGIDRCGNRLSGIHKTSCKKQVATELLDQGILVRRVTRKWRTRSIENNRKISQQDITVLFRQLATLHKSGIPLIHSMDIIAAGQVKKHMKTLLNTVKKNLEEGFSLAESLKKHRQFFSDLFCSLIQAGEQSGTLDCMLHSSAVYKEKMTAIQKKIRRTLLYPMTVLIMAVVISALLLVFVVPQFVKIYQDFGAELPGITRVVMQLSRLFQSLWLVFLVGTITCIVATLQLKKHSQPFCWFLDQQLLRIPLAGNIIKKSILARFSRMLSITSTAGLPMVNALHSVADATGNRVYCSAVQSIGNQIAMGQSLLTAMTATGLFPAMVLQMIAVGEESGSLEEMLCKIADIYEEEVDYDLHTLTDLLEPVIMSVTGLAVGGLILAMYLPVFKLGSVM